VGSAAFGQQQKQFSIEEDLSALTGAPDGQAPNNSLMTGGTGAPGMPTWINMER